MTMDGGSMIDVRNLGRHFGARPAVAGVSFQVAAGELFGFLGPNGAGKTTTISMLCTLLRPTCGIARIDGCDVVRQRSAVRRAVGLVFQQPTLDESLSAEQNMRCHAYAYGVPAGVRERRIRELLTLVELWDRRAGSVRTFSGGMKRRLEIARGLLHQPRVLFLDEPTLGLDPQTRRRVWDYLAELRGRQQLTIFLTTHYLDEADQCDRIAIIDRGRIVALDTPEGLKRGVGGDRITLSTPDPQLVARELGMCYGITPQVVDGQVRFKVPGGEAFLPAFVLGFRHPLEAIGLRRPTLDDVFLHLTGRELRDQEVGATVPVLLGGGTGE
jgi:ABC-2 type transport system ATP-binding protein